ncbi:MAG: glycosyltransferase family 2 protein [Labedaea sp.]
MTVPRTTVIVVTWRGRAHITACLDGLAGQDRPHWTVVVDNASDDGTAELLAVHPSRPEVLRLPDNAGYAGGLAAALPSVRTELVAWLNDDAVPDPGWLAALEDALDADPGAAAASARLESPDGVPTSFGVRLTRLGYGADHLAAGSGEVFGFCGGAALLRTGALTAAGGVPADFFCYYEDTDTAWRLRLAGWTVRSVPDARAAHLLGASTRPGSWRFHLWNERNRLLMLLRCAPGRVAVRELARFAALTAVLPVRRCAPDRVNFRLGLRLRVLGEVLVRLPAALIQRRRIGRTSTLRRDAVWRAFAG